MDDSSTNPLMNTRVQVALSQLLDNGFLLGQVNALQYNVEPSTKCIRSLNFLQSGRQAPIDDNGVDECVRFQLDYMSPEVLDQIHYIPGGGTHINLFRDVMTTPSFGSPNFEVTLKTLQALDSDFFTRIRTRQFTLWLINTGCHWVSIILHIQDRKVANYSINDPMRDPNIIQRVDARLRYMLQVAGIPIVPTQAQRKDTWFPKQLGGRTCGIRQFEILRVMLERINDRYHLKGADNLYDDSLWAPMSGDFQSDKVRQQMMGIICCRAMKHLDYKARMSVTPRERIRGFRGPRDVRRLDAFDGLEPVQSQTGAGVGQRRVGRRRAAAPTPDVQEDAKDVENWDTVMLDAPPLEPERRVTRSRSRVITSGPIFG